MSTTVYLVSGSNRGIGLAVVTFLASRPSTLVFAGARNPPSANDLHALESKYPGKLHTVKLTSTDKADNEAAVAEIKRVAGRLDVVIANAGICSYFGAALDTPAEQMMEHYEINVVGPLVLFQATYPLLKASTPSPKFVIVSSRTGSITDGARLPIGTLAYSASKAGVNYLARKLHFEHEGLVCFPMSPGLVETDMAKLSRTKESAMQDRQFITVEESAAGIVERVDKAERESDGPTFLNYNGTTIPW